MEEIRLVIWDLDGVYWPGTLAEGTARPQMSAAQTVRALNRRGIMNAICSKNDPDPVARVLDAQDMAAEFIFADIGFGPKGARVADIIAVAQLRPASVLFIDDEPANLAEAVRAVPGLNVAGPDLVAHLLDNPRLRGKPDAALTRLAAYRLLEARRTARVGSSADHETFLRESGITVRLIMDVEAHLERAIELINRTNQLNFTKKRLPEDPARGAEALRDLLARYDVFAGLVEVRDHYGDYGLSGFFVLRGGVGSAVLEHFCFSCRLLDMGIERWLYERLGRPAIEGAGPVAGSLTGPMPDWISEQDGPVGGAVGPLIDRLVLRGGCDLAAMSHYLRGLTREMAHEFNTIRAGRQFRIDHAAFLPLALTPPDAASRAMLAQIGYQESDWTSALSTPPLPREVWLFSFWTDSYVQLYQHGGLAMPFLLEDSPHADQDVTALSPAMAAPFLRQPENHAAWDALCTYWRAVGAITPEAFRAYLAPLLAAGQGRAVMIFMLAPEVWRNRPDQPLIPFPRARALNDVLRDLARGHEDVWLIDMLDFAPPGWHGPETAHFNRATYAAVAAHIGQRIAARFGVAALAGG